VSHVLDSLTVEAVGLILDHSPKQPASGHPANGGKPLKLSAQTLRCRLIDLFHT
jgi:hypothetical protein